MLKQTAARYLIWIVLAPLALPATAEADDGYDLWLRYEPLAPRRLAEQRRLASGVLAFPDGDVILPDGVTRRREVARHRERQRKTFLDSDRYVLEVDFRTYARQMKADLKSGRAGA